MNSLENYADDIEMPLLEDFKGSLISDNSLITKLIWPEKYPIVKGGIAFYSFSTCEHIDTTNLTEINSGTALQSFPSVKELEFTNLEKVASGKIIQDFNLLESLSFPKLTTIDLPTVNNDTKISQCNRLKKVDLPILKYFYNTRLFYNCPKLTEVNLPELEYTINNSETGIFDGRIAAEHTSKIIINLPKLKDTGNSVLYILRYPTIYIDPEHNSNTTEDGKLINNPEAYIIVNLGAPKEGYISLGCGGNDNYSRSPYLHVKEIHIQEGFRSALHIGSFTELTHDNLLEILNNLEDNSDYISKRITLGSINLQKLSDEEKSIATNKNYTLA